MPLSMIGCRRFSRHCQTLAEFRPPPPQLFIRCRRLYYAIITLPPVRLPLATIYFSISYFFVDIFADARCHFTLPLIIIISYFRHCIARR